ncbi:MAG: hypothetical protein LC672_00795, partial [Acidobacteria bacterium]|nr:hypothetical protein [Acidobacteriota bacterium]
MRPPNHYQTKDRRPDKSKSLSARTRPPLGPSARRGRAARSATLLALFSALITVLHASASYAWPAGARAAAPVAAAPSADPAAARDFASGFFSAALFQLTSESVQTYAADCTTPKDAFTLGDTV